MNMTQRYALKAQYILAQMGVSWGNRNTYETNLRTIRAF